MFAGLPSNWSVVLRVVFAACLSRGAGLQLESVDMLRGLRKFLNMDTPEDRTIDCPKERGVKNRNGR